MEEDGIKGKGRGPTGGRDAAQEGIEEDEGSVTAEMKTHL